MKNRKINFIKLGILFFGISLILWNCNLEDNLPVMQKDIDFKNVKTVSFEEAIALFNREKKKIQLKRTAAKSTENVLEVTPIWSTLKHNEISYTDAQLATVESNINREGNYSSQLYFINVDNNIKNVIFTIYKDEVDINGDVVNARVYFSDLEGNFIDGYRIENGLFTKRFVAKTRVQKASFLSLFLLQEDNGDDGGEIDFDCWVYSDGELDEVVVFASVDGSGGGSDAGYKYGTPNGFDSYGSYINDATHSGSYSSGNTNIGNLTSSQITSAAAAILMVAPIVPDEDGNCPEGYRKEGNTCVIEDETYFCDCNCEGSETEFTNDLANNMEPKWGQLANKQEILNEINSIPNLNSLSFENQILALENHFNKNLMYSTSLPIVILNPNDDINKYIFTETAGWLDFHHIFKLFKWTNSKGPVSALFAGEMGELLQSLKGNYSAYSYEDLPSNNVGVALYIRFGKQLKEGTISWKDAVGKALDEMKWTQPEDAPNIDYIPFLLKDNYPKNFTYQPLLGERLKEYHKNEFCKLKKSQQENIKSVHEKFRR